PPFGSSDDAQGRRDGVARPVPGTPARWAAGEEQPAATRGAATNGGAAGSAEREVLRMDLLVGEPEAAKSEHDTVRQADGAADEDIPLGDVGHRRPDEIGGKRVVAKLGAGADH